jgi:hypothetical protein
MMPHHQIRQEAGDIKGYPPINPARNTSNPMTTGSIDEFRMAQLIASGSWRAFAACWSVDPDLFFPVPSPGKSLDQVTRPKAAWPSAGSGASA